MRSPPASRVSAIIPCTDIDAAERWWNGLGFFGPAGENPTDYRILSDADGATIHLQPAIAGWLVAGRNPFGVYLSTARVDRLAEAAGNAILGAVKAPRHTEWGMYEFALNGPDDLLVRIGWPSRLLHDEGDDAAQAGMDDISG
ncbi:VOC family protein [Gluconacetobacter takamatsuzukensis]|uniref:Glyoxalase n=1 Tax=Gluconacetobacter takamatsuzukensis TaxID=1286190 RepID=A0A7W4PQP2_9PROT|nr:glyoxalase [Gluconacetobacter takamatsuzukensis]MBB2206603.1 glyoxalase [Gluconacetobacter takamatsuzukensis]